jgi:hypothetical protein
MRNNHVEQIVKRRSPGWTVTNCRAAICRAANLQSEQAKFPASVTYPVIQPAHYGCKVNRLKCNKNLLLVTMTRWLWRNSAAINANRRIILITVTLTIR